MVETVGADVQRASASEDDDEGPGWTSRWLRADPVRAVALLLIVVQLLWRVKITFGGYIAHDDFYLAIVASESDLNLDFLLSFFNNHLMPAPQAYIWLVTEKIGYAYWPYGLALIIGQLVLSLLFLRLVRLLIRPGWGQLVPLAIFLFSPLNLETTSWWVFGMFMLPMEIAMVWAAIAQIQYARTRHWYHLVSLGLALVFGFLFAEKALLILPLVFGLTACLLVKGSFGRSISRALTRFWRSWAVLAGISGAYLALYFQHSESSLREPSSVDQVFNFAGQFFGATLIPGLLGGPWNWLTGGTGPPLAAPSSTLHLIAVFVFLGLMAFTVWRRPAAGRAWWLLASYAGLAFVMIAATRMGAVLSDLAGLTTRYVADVAVVGALCIGVAIFGLQDFPDTKPVRRVEWLHRMPFLKPVLTSAIVLLLAIGTIQSTSVFTRGWADQPGRTFLNNAQQALKNAPEGTVFLDRHVPENVMAKYYFPVNLQSRFFGPAPLQPTWVTEAESPSMFADDGTIKPAWVDGRTSAPGPDGLCGYAVKAGEIETVKLSGPTLEWVWTVRMAYMTAVETKVTVQLGGGIYEFTAKPGKIRSLFFQVKGSGDQILVSIDNPKAELCTKDFIVGYPVPWLL